MHAWHLVTKKLDKNVTKHVPLIFIIDLWIFFAHPTQCKSTKSTHGSGGLGSSFFSSSGFSSLLSSFFSSSFPPSAFSSFFSSCFSSTFGCSYTQSKRIKVTKLVPWSKNLCWLTNGHFTTVVKEFWTIV